MDRSKNWTRTRTEVRTELHNTKRNIITQNYCYCYCYYQHYLPIITHVTSMVMCSVVSVSGCVFNALNAEGFDPQSSLSACGYIFTISRPSRVSRSSGQLKDSLIVIIIIIIIIITAAHLHAKRPLHFTDVLSFFQTPPSEVTKQYSTKLHHMFGSDPNL